MWMLWKLFWPKYLACIHCLHETLALDGLMKHVMFNSYNHIYIFCGQQCVKYNIHLLTCWLWAVAREQSIYFGIRIFGIRNLLLSYVSFHSLILQTTLNSWDLFTIKNMYLNIFLKHFKWREKMLYILLGITVLIPGDGYQ